MADAAAKALAADPKFRKYSTLVEKTLQSFDQVNEWADFITFLGQSRRVVEPSSVALTPARRPLPPCSQAAQGASDCLFWLTRAHLRRRQCLQGYPQFQVIPHKLTVAKRLSQCLNPALPTGVHQRALDVYTHILTTIGVSSPRGAAARPELTLAPVPLAPAREPQEGPSSVVLGPLPFLPVRSNVGQGAQFVSLPAPAWHV